MRALLFSKYCSEKRTMYVTHSCQNSVTDKIFIIGPKMGILINNMKIIHTSTFTIIRTNAINGCRGGGTYFAEYDWTCRNQVGYLYGSVCDLKFFPIAASKKYLQL